MDAACTIQDSIHVFSLVRKYVSRILGTYQYSDHEYELTNHHVYSTASYSIAACSVLRCTGGFCYSPHSKQKGG